MKELVIKQCNCKVRHPLRAVLENGDEHLVHVCPGCHRIHGLPSLGISLTKSNVPLGPNDHWITLKPHGPESDSYVHVVIREHPDGTASIIRSPGGKLNYLHFSKLGKQDDWKDSAKTRAKEKREKEKARVAELTPEQREAEQKKRDAVDTRKDEMRRDFITNALKTLGHNPDDYFTPESELNDFAPEMRDRLQKAETRMAAGKLDKIIRGLRDDLGAALDTISASDLGDTPLSLLVPPEPIGGDRMGYNSCVADRARNEGLTPDTLAAEESDIRRRHYEEKAAQMIESAGGEITPDAVSASADILEDKARALYEAMRDSRESVVQAINAGVIRSDIPDAKSPDMATTLKLIQLRHDYKQKEAAIRQLERGIGAKPANGDGSYMVTEDAKTDDIYRDMDAAIKALTPEDAAKALDNEMNLTRMQNTASEFFNTLESEEAANASLGGHFATGRYNVLNTFWLNVTGAPLPFDRADIDTVGSEAAAALVVSNLRDQLSPDEFEAARRGFTKWHEKTQRDRAQQSVDEYHATMQEYEGIDIPQATDADSIVAAQVQLDRKAELIRKARNVLGTTHGALEISAEISKQFEYPAGNGDLRCPLGRTDPADAVKNAHALGLDDSDYQIDKRGSETYLTINPDGAKKLQRSVDPERAERMRVIDSIKHGDADGGPGWLPAGIISRPKTTFDDRTNQGQQISAPVSIDLKMTTDQIENTLTDHIGERLCGGEPIEAIRADLTGQSFIETHVPEVMRPAYFDALSRLKLMATTADDAAHPADLASLADAYANRWAQTNGVNPKVDAQSIDHASAYEAAFRVMAGSEPKEPWIFKHSSEYTRDDRRSIRGAFARQNTGETWDEFVSKHDSVDAAYAEVAENTRGKFIDQFVDHYGRVTGKTIDKTKVQMESNPARMRTSIGARAEAQLASIFPYAKDAMRGVSGKITLPQGINMSDGDFVKQQRMIKLFLSQKRMANSTGVGSGKSLMSIGAFTQGHADGKFERGIFSVPSSVQAQFGGEMARYTEPGRYKWHAKPGASKEERHAAYADPTNHVVVVTHEALRDDIVTAIADHKFNGDVARAGDFLRTANRDERKTMVADAIKAKGWHFGMGVVDEGHKLLNRKGKENSLMANAIGGLTDSLEYYMPMSADPVKNDLSEVHDFLSKIAPGQYDDEAGFKRKYGVNTEASAESLKREMSLYQYAERISPPVTATRQTIAVPLSEQQRDQYSRVNDAFARLRRSRRTDTPDVDAAKTIAPGRFESAPPEEHEAIAREIASNPGLYRNRAYDNIVNSHPVESNAKVHRIVDIALSQKNGEGKQLPGLVFTRELEPVKLIAGALKDAGLSVGVYTGELNGAERRNLQQRFQNGGPSAPDIIIASDAGAEGVQLERGAFVINANVSDTAKTHEQRIGRIERLGQKNPSINVFDVITNTPYEHDKIKAQNTKKGLRDITTAPTESLDDSGMLHEIWAARQESFHSDVAHAGIRR